MENWIYANIDRIISKAKSETTELNHIIEISIYTRMQVSLLGKRSFDLTSEKYVVSRTHVVF